MSLEANFFQALRAYQDAKKSLFNKVKDFDSFRLEEMHKHMLIVHEELSQWRIGKLLSNTYHDSLESYNSLAETVKIPDLSPIKKIEIVQNKGRIVIEGIFEHIEEVETAKELLEGFMKKVEDIRKNDQFAAAESYRLALKS